MNKTLYCNKKETCCIYLKQNSATSCRIVIVPCTENVFQNGDSNNDVDKKTKHAAMSYGTVRKYLLRVNLLLFKGAFFT